jgi:hypothetical protein
MRVFLSYNTPDSARTEGLKKAIEAKTPDAEIFFAPTSLKVGRFWIPQLGESIGKADAFLLLVGENLGPYQTIEYYQAFERHTMQPGFPLVPVLMAEKAPGLPFISQIQWHKSAEPQTEPDLSRIIAALKGEAVAKDREHWRSVNPYRGLESLREEDAAFFFAREKEVQQVLKALMAPENKIITLVGNSGVGKSSLVEAGVFAALKRREWPGGGQWPEALKDSRQWALLTIRPGEDPVRALITAFADLWFSDATDPERIERRNKWEKLLLDGACGLSDLIDTTRDRFVRELQLAAPARVVININQSEELYSLTPAASRDTFSKLIAEGLADPRLAVLASLRSDYYGELQANRTLFDVSARVDVAPLDAAGLKLVITGPAETLGVRFETSELADFVVKGAGGDKGALPLLADYMTDLWARMQTRGDGVLRLADQADLVDAGRALSVRANKFLTQNPKDYEAVRRLFTLRLAFVPEEGEPVRRPISRDRLSPKERKIADKLASGEWRLLLAGTVKGSPDGPSIVEIAHEVLLTRWDSLREWLKAERQFLVMKGRVELARERWEREAPAAKRAALLLGLDLIQAEQWLATRGADFDAQDADFIKKSVAARDAELAAATRFRRMAFGAVSFMVLVVLFLVIHRNYSHWVETRPWAYLNLLPREDILPLSNKPGMIGREEPELESLNFDVSLPERNISRLHLQIAPDYKAFDQRSLFGTAINGRPLPYGESQVLEDGDIITLSGFYAFRFFHIDWRPWDYLFGSVETHVDPKELVRWNGQTVNGWVWGLVVDGNSRRVFPLDNRQHVVAELPDGSVAVYSGKIEAGRPLLDIVLSEFDRHSLFSRPIGEGRAFMVYREDHEAAGAELEKAPLCSEEEPLDVRNVAFHADIDDLKATVKDDDRYYHEYLMPKGEIVTELIAKGPGDVSPDCYPVHQFLFSTPSGSTFQVLILSPSVAERP